MAKGFNGGMPGGMNMNNLMKQAQKMQEKMATVQLELEQKTLEVTSGGGAVKIIITGKREIKEITLDKDVVDPEDIEMLQDLILSAVNEAVRQAGEMVDAEMAKVTGGLGGLPNGMF